MDKQEIINRMHENFKALREVRETEKRIVIKLEADFARLRGIADEEAE